MEELKGWKWEGLASIAELIFKVLGFRQNPEPNEVVVQWPKKVSITIFTTTALFFTIVFIKLPAVDSKLLEVTIMVIPGWLLGVILPICEILGNSNKLNYAKNYFIAAYRFFRHSDSNSIYPVII